MASDNDFEKAGQEAIEEFRKKYAALTPEQKEGVKIVVSWIRSWFMKAGYKHLCRNILKEF